MEKIALLSSVIAISAILTGCVSVPSNETNQIQENVRHSILGTWGIESLPYAAEKNIPPAPQASITFTAENVNGCAGDNRFFGSVKINGNSLHFSQLGMTKMMGPNAAYEDCFIKALNEVTSFAVKEKTYLLNKEGNVVMILKPEQKQ